MGQAVTKREDDEAAILVVSLGVFDVRLLLVAYSPGVSYTYEHNMDVFTHLTTMLAPIQFRHLSPPFFGTLEVFIINNDREIDLTVSPPGQAVKLPTSWFVDSSTVSFASRPHSHSPRVGPEGDRHVFVLPWYRSRP